jgi:hypothetical protein
VKLKSVFSLSVLILSSIARLSGSIAQNNDELIFSLLTYEKGEPLYAAFGHSAIRVANSQNNTDYVYNYGTLDLTSAGFYLSFLKGKLPYRLSRMPTSYVIEQNTLEQRTIIENRFILSEIEANSLLKILELNYLPHNRTYYYDFFFDNCATKIIQAIDTATHFKIKKEYPTYERKSFRKHIHQQLNTKPWVRLGIDILMGVRADRTATPTETSFLPDHLLSLLLANPDYFEPNGNVLINGISQNEKKKRTTTWFFLAVFISVLLLTYLEIKGMKKVRWLDHLLIWPAIIIGFILLFLWVYSDLLIFGINLNLFWANPLLVVYLINKSIPNWFRILIVCSILLSFIYSGFYFQDFAIIFYSTGVLVRFIQGTSNVNKSVPDII